MENVDADRLVGFGAAEYVPAEPPIKEPVVEQKEEKQVSQAEKEKVEQKEEKQAIQTKEDKTASNRKTK